MFNLILFGPPGSGKGTQASKIAAKYGLVHISTGDLFRHEMNNNTPLGLQAKEYMAKGELVPDSVTIGMLLNKIEAHAQAGGFIFDGFPRNINQSQALDELLAKLNSKIHLLISLEVPEDEIVKRILLRGESSGRVDDNDENIIRNRFAVYLQETAPVYEYYGKKDVSITLPGVGSIDSIFQSICNQIDRASA